MGGTKNSSREQQAKAKRTPEEVEEYVYRILDDWQWARDKSEISTRQRNCYGSLYAGMTVMPKRKKRAKSA